MKIEPRHDKTNKVTVRPAKTQISLGIRPVWSESSLPAWGKLGSLATQWAPSEDSDQTGRMPRLIWVFAGHTFTLLVLSCRGSIDVRDRAAIHGMKKLNCLRGFEACEWQNVASAKSDQSLLCCLNGYLRTQGVFMRTAKTLVRLGGCPGLSESSLGAHVILLVLSCGGSYNVVVLILFHFCKVSWW